MDYELFSVCTHNKYRKKGYAEWCVNVLQDRLLSQAGGKEVNLWTRVVDHLNGPYWQRRGFEVVDFVDCPKGMWHAKEDFRLLMMRKKLKKSEAETVRDLGI
jgi:Acetyltransferase (GNAT) family